MLLKKANLFIKKLRRNCESCIVHCFQEQEKKSDNELENKMCMWGKCKHKSFHICHFLQFCTVKNQQLNISKMSSYLTLFLAGNTSNYLNMNFEKIMYHFCEHTKITFLTFYSFTLLNMST